MITTKSKQELELMRHAGKILAETFAVLQQAVHPGVDTRHLDQLAYDYITSQNATPSFKNYNGFPGSICASPTERVVHGIPSKQVKLAEGDIISLDVGVCYCGYHADAARTFPVGSVSPEASRLIEVTRQSFFEGISKARPGNRLGDLSHAVQAYVESHGYSVVRDLVGHGIGAHLHESPDVPNFGSPGRGIRFVPGMTIAVEPMVNAGGNAVRVLKDGWSVVTKDGSLSAHYENTIIITEEEPEITTIGDGTC